VRTHTHTHTHTHTMTGDFCQSILIPLMLVEIVSCLVTLQRGTETYDCGPLHLLLSITFYNVPACQLLSFPLSKSLALTKKNVSRQIFITNSFTLAHISMSSMTYVFIFNSLVA